jgi:hypothetical protein
MNVLALLYVKFELSWPMELTAELKSPANQDSLKPFTTSGTEQRWIRKSSQIKWRETGIHHETKTFKLSVSPFDHEACL